MSNELLDIISKKYYETFFNQSNVIILNVDSQKSERDITFTVLSFICSLNYLLKLCFYPLYHIIIARLKASDGRHHNFSLTLGGVLTHLIDI